jgi:hypothetical protein
MTTGPDDRKEPEVEVEELRDVDVRDEEGRDAAAGFPT